MAAASRLGHNVSIMNLPISSICSTAPPTARPAARQAEYRDWVQTCSREYLRLKHDAEHGRKSFLNAYGATNEAEFFAWHGAVLRPAFFDDKTRPRSYRVLKEYFRQDPALRAGKISALFEIGKVD